MQISIWITLLVGMVCIITTIIIAWFGTKRSIEAIGREIGGAVEKGNKVIHENIKYSQEKLERKNQEGLRVTSDDRRI